MIIVGHENYTGVLIGFNMVLILEKQGKKCVESTFDMKNTIRGCVPKKSLK
jgi:hypothetical protein